MAITMLKEKTESIKINRKSIHCITFLDDIALVVDSEIKMNKIPMCQKIPFRNLSLK